LFQASASGDATNSARRANRDRRKWRSHAGGSHRNASGRRPTSPGKWHGHSGGSHRSHRSHRKRQRPAPHQPRQNGTDTPAAATAATVASAAPVAGAPAVADAKAAQTPEAGAPVAGANPSAIPVPVATPPPLPPYDAVAELDKQLKPLEENANATVKARLLYARSELAKLRKKSNEVEDFYEQISIKFKPEDLSPVLLALVGDFLLDKNRQDRAAILYTRLKEEYPKSDYVELCVCRPRRNRILAEKV